MYTYYTIHSTYTHAYHIYTYHMHTYYTTHSTYTHTCEATRVELANNGTSHYERRGEVVGGEVVGGDDAIGAGNVRKHGVQHLRRRVLQPVTVFQQLEKRLILLLPPRDRQVAGVQVLVAKVEQDLAVLQELVGVGVALLFGAAFAPYFRFAPYSVLIVKH